MNGCLKKSILLMTGGIQCPLCLATLGLATILGLATFIGFSDLNRVDENWLLNPVGTVV